jgi:dTDP-4-dehydrorhamnose 3,5-epimerase
MTSREAIVPSQPAVALAAMLPGAVKDAQTTTPTWEAADRRLIDGVGYHEVKNVLKGNGVLTEVLRAEWLPSNAVVDQIFAVTLQPGGLSAWHAHARTTDRLFALTGVVKVVLYDARPGSPTHGRVNEFRLGPARPALLVVPPGVWHGVQNAQVAEPSVLLNAVDLAYVYEDPDHWRLPADTAEIPYRFDA